MSKTYNIQLSSHVLTQSFALLNVIMLGVISDHSPRVTHHTDSNCMLYNPDQSFRFPLPKIQTFRQGTSKKLRRQQSKSTSKSRGMGRASLGIFFCIGHGEVSFSVCKPMQVVALKTKVC